MERLEFWLSLLLASYVGVAMCLVMLGQPVRPLSHLVKATSFWFILSWIGVAAALALMLWR